MQKCLKRVREWGKDREEKCVSIARKIVPLHDLRKKYC